jgi:hypothetical protein
MSTQYLGEGMEGVVWRKNDKVIKRFRPNAMSDSQAAALDGCLHRLGPAFPVCASLHKIDGVWEIHYPWFDSEEVRSLSMDETRRFLARCIAAGVVADNFKLANLRRVDGELVYIDLGKQVGALRQTVFRDTAAKAFALLSGLMTEEQLIASFARFRRDGGVENMPGFSMFYASVVRMAAEQYWATCPNLDSHTVSVASNVSLLIKCCSMDAESLERQVSHIVAQLSTPRRFHEVVLAIDPWEGAFVRPHASGNLHALRKSANRLNQCGVVDRVIESPSDAGAVSSLYQRWFGLECNHTHAASGIPVFPQLWAFENLSTRYVLQADADVLIGRLDPMHDYLLEMLAAFKPHDVMGVGFNIPHAESGVVKPFDAPVGHFKPEVRLGLFDLERFRTSLPWENSVDGGKLMLGWYQSLYRELSSRELRCLRGGDARTFYVHPMNTAKKTKHLVERARSRIESGSFPAVQSLKWDLVEEPSEWAPIARAERIVFLVMGGDIPLHKVQRCVRSLLGQSDQEFGVVFVDDGSDPIHASNLSAVARALGSQVSFISHDSRQGRLRNKWDYIRHVIQRDDTLIVVLDMDDALMSSEVVSQLKDALACGSHVLVGGMHRPEKPLKLYPVQFNHAAANRSAGNVWIHLRCFTKSAFMSLSEIDFISQDGWVDRVSDYVTMVPMVSRTNRHQELEGFLCWHERTSQPTPHKRRKDDDVIDMVLNRNRPKNK